MEHIVRMTKKQQRKYISKINANIKPALAFAAEEYKAIKEKNPDRFVSLGKLYCQRMDQLCAKKGLRQLVPKND